MDRQRIDKWLWHGRLVRTRTAAASLVESGHVRVNGQRVEIASRPLRAGDVVTVALDRTVRVLKVTGFAERRGSAEIARALYEDLAPRDSITSRPTELPAAAPIAVREPGEGRPTKRDRRAIERLKRDDEF